MCQDLRMRRQESIYMGLHWGTRIRNKKVSGPTSQQKTKTKNINNKKTAKPEIKEKSKKEEEIRIIIIMHILPGARIEPRADCVPGPTGY